MKPGLRLGFSQQLSLTPQLKQAIRLLQLSAIELEQEIREALENNPLLENADEATGGEAAADGDAGESPGTEDGPELQEPPAPEPVAESPTEPETEDWHAELAETASEWDAPPRGAGPDGEGESLEARTSAPQTLLDHLLWQLNLTPCSPRDRSIAAVLLEALDDDGYLREPVDAIQAALRPEIEATEAEIEAVRHRLQRFDPVGVASRHLGECLDVQLALLDPDTPALAIARRLVTGPLELLARADVAKLAERHAATPGEIETALELVRALNPRPGNQYGDVAAEYIVPDAYAYRHEGRWRVRLNPSCHPSLAINRDYERLAAETRSEAGGFLRGRLQEARWLIKSLRQRSETLIKVASCIVRQQSAYLDYGPEAMRPLTLREVAEDVGVHESTVSRITTRKYLHTPRGTFEFKHFFSVGLATAEGGEASATAIRAMIRKLVEDEDPKKPLSDSAIAGELNKRGIAVARRTVAKYREAMNIPASSDRCRLA